MPQRSESVVLVKAAVDCVAFIEPTTAIPSKQRPVIASTSTEVYKYVRYVSLVNHATADLLIAKGTKSGNAIPITDVQLNVAAPPSVKMQGTKDGVSFVARLGSSNILFASTVTFPPHRVLCLTELK